MRLVLALTVAWLIAVPSAAQPYLPDITDLVSRGELKVGMIKRDFPPMVTTAEDGTVTGYDVEIAKMIAEALGIQLRIIRTEATADGVVDQVARGEVDIGLSYLSRTVYRAREVIFTTPYLTEHPSLLVNRVFAAKRSDPCPTIDEFVTLLSQIRIGVTTDSADVSRLAAIDADARLTTFDTFAAMMQALRSGTVAMSFQGEIVARQYLADYPQMRVFATLCDLSPWTDQIAIAVNSQDAGLVPFLDVLLDHVHIVVGDDQAISMTTTPWKY